jgi:hypothetical protein
VRNKLDTYIFIIVDSAMVEIIKINQARDKDIFGQWSGKLITFYTTAISSSHHQLKE